MLEVPPVPLQQKQHPIMPAMTPTITMMKLVNPRYSNHVQGQASSLFSAGIILGGAGRGLTGAFW